MKTITRLAAILIVLAPTFGAAADSCRQTSYGKCYKVHGRYSVYGNGQNVLWPVGTHRLLNVMAGDEAPYKLVEDDLDGYDVFGDFVVCPLEKDVAGAMRKVCMQSANNMHRTKRPAD